MNKHEFKYIIYAGLFALAWFLFALPYLIKKFDGSSPFLQFLLFNVGLIVLLQVFLKSFTLSTSIRWKLTIGMIFTFVALDVIQPPYLLSSSGDLISEGPILVASSSDYIVGLLWKAIGFSGILLYLATYVLAPLILLAISAKLLSNFVRNI